MMNTKTLLLWLVTASLGMTGCQKATDANIQIDSNNEGLGVSCKTDTAYVDPSLLQIEGAPVAQKGQAVTYQLNEDLGCSSSQTVSWKTVGASGALSKSGSSLRSAFTKAGEYTVVAKVEGTSLVDSGSSQKASALVSNEISFKTVVVGSQIALVGPSLAMVGSNISYSLAVPAGVSIESATWDFGDASALINSVNPVNKVFGRAGTYQLKVAVVDSNQVLTNLSQSITVVMIQDGLDCVSDLAISGASEATVGVPVALSIYIPSCLKDKITAVQWNFGDGKTSGNQSVSHTYQNAGNYQISAQIFINGSETPWVTLNHDMTVTMPAPEPTPTATPEPTVSPSPSESPSPSPSPSPTATPEPTPVNPNACSVSGQERKEEGEIYTETQSCGLSGTKTLSYRDITVERCQLQGEFLQWVQVSETKKLLSEGACQGQSCKLPDGSILADGASKVLYSTQTPAGSCSTVSQTRTCSNGVLSGSSDYSQLTCHEGCGNFGSHGTVKTSVITGEIKVPLTCEFGEEGYFNIVNQVSDQTCKDGQIVNSNTQSGSVKVAGSCPNYTYTPTENWTQCSADCGGKQTRIFVCKDSNGNQAPADRCKVAAPVEERVCDGNPEAVRRQEQAVSQEEANSSETCPKNQIGVVSKIRDVITTTTFACIDHKVQKAGEAVTYGAWVTEKYCRDYVAQRCSHDSLSNADALNRFKWMVKCQDQVPVIKEFLANFQDVGVKISGTKVEIDNSKGRLLYPTFMNRATKPEKAWVAPKNPNASCEVPATVYIAAVCVSSCATPEQQILAEERPQAGLKYVTYIEALTKNYDRVATLKNNFVMSSKEIQKTKVDQWVTELLDGDHDIIVFKMKSGRSLRLTPNHPILAADGLMKAADKFKVGDKLVMLGGVLDPIVSLEHMVHHGKVYNVFVKSSDLHHNIVVTNGYLNGTAFFQENDGEKMNRQIFKNKMTQGVFSK